MYLLFKVDLDLFEGVGVEILILIFIFCKGLVFSLFLRECESKRLILSINA